MNNKFIVIEGACDGIGKSTQFDLLRRHLEFEGEDVVSHHFPSYDTYQGKPVEEYLKGSFGQPNELSPYFVNALYALDRGITWYSVLKDLYNEGKTIILDRYTPSSLIYQSALIEDLDERKRFINYIVDFEYNKIGIKEPDSIIFLHAPFELATKLRNERKENDGIKNDIHESNIEFMKKVYDNGMFLADYLNWDKVDCSNGNALRSIEDIHFDVHRLVKKR